MGDLIRQHPNLGELLFDEGAIHRPILCREVILLLGDLGAILPLQLDILRRELGVVGQLGLRGLPCSLLIIRWGWGRDDGRRRWVRTSPSLIRE